MSSTEDVLKHEYASSLRWVAMKMIQRHESDQRLAYVHGFDAGIDLLCARAELSNPAISEDIRELANKMAEETAETLRSMMGENRTFVIGLILNRT